MKFFSNKETHEVGDLIRILIYPNITWKEDLSQDSFIQVISQDISSLNEMRDDLWFYVPVTERTSMLNFDNVTQLIVGYPSYPNAMRVHFDFFDHKKYLKNNEYDFDLIYTHLPEHTSQLKNLVRNKTRHRPTFFGYCHWFEFEDVTEYNERLFPQSMLGILDMESCYVNTKAQKQLALKESKEWFNEEMVKELEQKMEPFYLGVERNEVIKENEINKFPEKTIVFNHRPQEYKNFGNFLEICDKLYQKRKDFKVWIPLLDSSNRDYIYCDEWEKEKYYKHLNNCCVGFGPKQVYKGWSMSVLDGLKNGLPFILFDEKYYHELWEKADFFQSNDEAINLLEKYLDDNKYRNKKSLEGIRYCRNERLHVNSVHGLNLKINNYIKNQRRMKENSEAIDKIKKYIKRKKRVLKKDIIKWLTWGEQIPWTPYRRTILDDENFSEVRKAVSEYVYLE